MPPSGSPRGGACAGTGSSARRGRVSSVLQSPCADGSADPSCAAVSCPQNCLHFCCQELEEWYGYRVAVSHSQSCLRISQQGLDVWVMRVGGDCLILLSELCTCVSARDE